MHKRCSGFFRQGGGVKGLGREADHSLSYLLSMSRRLELHLHARISLHVIALHYVIKVKVTCKFDLEPSINTDCISFKGMEISLLT
jgi:hypothetical protein